MAWRNIWRNKGRSLALLFAIGIGVSAGLILMALSYGLIQQRFINLIEGQFSHVQIHQAEYMEEREPQLWIPDYLQLTNTLDTMPMVKAYSGRVIAQAMLTSSYGAAGVELTGIDPDKEIIDLKKQLVEGDYLSPNLRNPVLISAKTAEKLRLNKGDRLVMTFQNTHGEMVSAAFRVAGLYSSSNTSYDEGHAYVKASDLQVLLNDQKPVWHEVALMTEDFNRAPDLRDIIQTYFPKLEVRDWKSLSPEANLLMEQGNFFSYIFLIIILLGLAFGILNTMLMSVFERQSELGMLMAIGMGKKQIAGMIILETVYLTLFGGLIGLLTGLAVIAFFQENGLQLSGFDDALAAYGYDSVIFPAINGQNILLVAGLVFTIALLSSITPALRAIRLKPAEAVRKI
jgi:ABC-type lipoprotein release transport system permease subunit